MILAERDRAGRNRSCPTLPSRRQDEAVALAAARSIACPPDSPAQAMVLARNAG